MLDPLVLNKIQTNFTFNFPCRVDKAYATTSQIVVIFEAFQGLITKHFAVFLSNMLTLLCSLIWREHWLDICSEFDT